MTAALEKQLPLATVHGLYHIAVKTENLAATRKFYVEIIGLREFPRPDFGYPGAWLGCTQPGDQDVVLDRDGDAIERTQGTAVLPSPRAGFGGVDGAGFVQGDDRVELWIDIANARQRRPLVLGRAIVWPRIQTPDFLHRG